MTSDSDSAPSDQTHIPLGLFCILIGAAAMWIARSYETGTVISMGPGFFPKAISGLLIAFGAIILVARGRDLPAGDNEESSGALALWPVLRILSCITGSILIFALTLKGLGLPISTFLMVLVASLARRGTQPLAIVITALVLSVLATLLFAFALRLQIPVLPEFLR